MSQQLPRIGQDLVENNKATAPFYLWFSRIQSALNAGAITSDEALADIATIATILGSPDADVDTIPPLNFLRVTTYVRGADGVLADGTLSGGGVELSTDWQPHMARAWMGF